MKIEKNVIIQRKPVNNVQKKDFHKPYTKVLIDFVNGTDDNICIEFNSNEELIRAYGCVRGYHQRHKLNAVDFKMNQELNKLYLVRKQQKEKVKTEYKTTIAGILFCHGNDDYGMWEGFSLTKEEENIIWAILEKHDTEGCSVRGTRKQIAREMEG